MPPTKGQDWQNKVRAVKQVQKWLYQDPLFLDTETTGYGQTDEVIEIAVMDLQGQVVFYSLVKPTKPIPHTSIAIHGITEDDVKDAPKWIEIYDTLVELLKNRTIIAYNAAFDWRLIEQTSAKYGLEMFAAEWKCVMNAYSFYKGDWNSKFGNYKWYKLKDAASSFGISPKDPLHRSLADTHLTLELTKKLASIDLDTDLSLQAYDREKVEFVFPYVVVLGLIVMLFSLNVGWLLTVAGLIFFPIEIRLPKKRQKLLFNQALQEIEQKKWPNAVKTLEKLLSLNEDNDNARLLLTQIYFEKQEYEKSLAFANGYKGDKYRDTFLYISAVSLYNIKRYQEALDLLKLIPDDADLRENKFIWQGIILYELGDYDASIKALRKGPVRRRIPDDSMLRAKYYLAKAYLKKGNKKQAITQFRGVYQADVNYKDAARYLWELEEKVVS